MIIDSKHPHCLHYVQQIKGSDSPVFAIGENEVAHCWEDEVSYDYIRSVPDGEYACSQPLMDSDVILDLMEDALAHLSEEERVVLVTDCELYAGHWSEQGPSKEELGSEYPSIYLDATVGCLWLAREVRKKYIFEEKDDPVIVFTPESDFFDEDDFEVENRQEILRIVSDETETWTYYVGTVDGREVSIAQWEGSGSNAEANFAEGHHTVHEFLLSHLWLVEQDLRSEEALSSAADD